MSETLRHFSVSAITISNLNEKTFEAVEAKALEGVSELEGLE